MNSTAEKIDSPAPSYVQNLTSDASADAIRAEQLAHLMRGGVAPRSWVAEEFAAAAFPFINAVLFKFLLGSAYYAAVAVSLEPSVAFAISLIALPLLAFSQRSLVYDAATELRAGRAGMATALECALAVSWLILFSALFFDRSLLVGEALYLTIPALHALVAMLRWFERTAFEYIDGRTCYPEPRFSEHCEILTAPQSGQRLPRVGDVIRLKAGAQVPTDCTVLDGAAVLDERRISPVPGLRIRERGAVVPGGATVLSGAIDCRVDGLPEESHFAGLVTHLRRRLQRYWEMREERLDHEILIFNGTIFAVAFGSAIYWFASGAGIMTAASSLMAVLLTIPLVRAVALTTLVAPLAETALFREGLVAADGLVLERAAQLSGLVLDCNPRSPVGEARVRAIEMLDPRISEEALDALLCSVLGRFDEPGFIAIVDDVRRRRGRVSLVDIKNLKYYPGQGVCGELDKVEFSIGNEGFLLARGVLLQQSDLVASPHEQSVTYVALGEEVTARIRLAEPFSLDARELITQLRGLGIRPILTARADGSLDEMGRAIGLELSEIHVFAEVERYRQKLLDWSGMALFVTQDTPPEIRGARRPTIAVFDELRWDLNDGDIMLMTPRLASIPALFSIPRIARSVYRQNIALSLVLGAGLVVGGLLAVIPPWAGAAAVLCAVLFVNLNLMRLPR